MDESQSKFNINFVREVYLVGDAAQAANIRKALKGYYFLVPRDATGLGSFSEEAHFVVAIADFTSPLNMQAVARMFASAEAPSAHRIVFVTAPDVLTREQLLFAQEVGARYVCTGKNRLDEIKLYLKRVCLEMHQLGSLAAFEDEMKTALASRDTAALMRIAEKLRGLESESEDSLRLLSIIYMQVNDIKRAEVFLKRILTLNPQNLWAANALGKFYLRNGRASQGLEILQKLSAFHELNSERLLELGNAQAVAGQTEAAAANLAKTAKLVGDEDPRVKEGLAKVKLAQKDLQGALDCLGSKTFSEEVLSFLNMRAIMAIRGEKFAEGIDYYDYAVKGAGSDHDVKAKLKFNMGLAYVRTGDIEKAQQALRESCELGGPRFQRARGPLETVSAILKTKGKPKKEETVQIEESEWETLF